MTDEREPTPERTAHPIPPPKRRKGGDRDSCSNENQQGNNLNHKSTQDKTSMQGKCIEVVSKLSKDEVSKYDADQSSEYESSEEDKSEVKASDAPEKVESSIVKYTDVSQATKLNAVKKWLDRYYDQMISDQTHYWPVTNPHDRFGNGDGTPWPYRAASS